MASGSGVVGDITVIGALVIVMIIAIMVASVFALVGHLRKVAGPPGPKSKSELA